MASVLATHFCETRVKLPTEGSGIVIFFFVRWMSMDFLVSSVMSYHSALDLYLCNLLRLQVTPALLGLSSIGSSHGLFSLVNMNFLSGAKVQNQCTKAVAESVVVMLAASLFVSTSVL